MLKRYVMMLTGAAFFMALDQLHKWWMLEVVRIHERSFIEVTGFFNFVMVWNTGISFGMFSGHPEIMQYALSVMAIIIVLALLFWLRGITSGWTWFGSSMVIGGALGNVIDRLRFGAVADFFDVHVAGWHWPAFNIADSLIFCGVVLIGMVSIYADRRTKEQ